MKPFVLIALILWIADNFIREVLRNRGEITRIREDRHSSLLVIIYLLIVFSVPLLNFVDGSIFTVIYLHGIGVMLQIAGIIVRISAMKTLQKFYTGTLQIIDNHVIVKKGWYKFVRHPGYLSVLLSSLGFGLAVGNWIGLFVIIISFLFIYSYRIASEEKMMINNFGDEYLEYIKSTKKLIPFVY